MSFFDNIGIGERQFIEEWLEQLNVKEYTINDEDLSVDIFDYSVYFVNQYHPLKYKINSCNNLYFTNCEFNELENFPNRSLKISLENCTGISEYNKLFNLTQYIHLYNICFNELNCKISDYKNIYRISLENCTGNIKIYNGNCSDIKIIQNTGNICITDVDIYNLTIKNCTLFNLPILKNIKSTEIDLSYLFHNFEPIIYYIDDYKENNITYQTNYTK